MIFKNYILFLLITLIAPSSLIASDLSNLSTVPVQAIAQETYKGHSWANFSSGLGVTTLSLGIIAGTVQITLFDTPPTPVAIMLASWGAGSLGASAPYVLMNINHFCKKRWRSLRNRQMAGGISTGTNVRVVSESTSSQAQERALETV